MNADGKEGKSLEHSSMLICSEEDGEGNNVI